MSRYELRRETTNRSAAYRSEQNLCLGPVPASPVELQMRASQQSMFHRGDLFYFEGIDQEESVSVHECYEDVTRTRRETGVPGAMNAEEGPIDPPFTGSLRSPSVAHVA